MPKHSPFVMGRTAEYQDRFMRQHTGSPPEPAPAFQGWWVDVRDAVLLVLACSAAWWLLGVIFG